MPSPALCFRDGHPHRKKGSGCRTISSLIEGNRDEASRKADHQDLPSWMDSRKPAEYRRAEPRMRSAAFHHVVGIRKTRASLPNVQDEPRPGLARAVLLGA